MSGCVHLPCQKKIFSLARPTDCRLAQRKNLLYTKTKWRRLVRNCGILHIFFFFLFFFFQSLNFLLLPETHKFTWNRKLEKTKNKFPVCFFFLLLTKHLSNNHRNILLVNFFSGVFFVCRLISKILLADFVRFNWGMFVVYWIFLVAEDVEEAGVAPMALRGPRWST